MCPKPFSWAKSERKLFSDGKSRGPLLAGAALKMLVHSAEITEKVRTGLSGSFRGGGLFKFRSVKVNERTVFSMSSLTR